VPFILRKEWSRYALLCISSGQWQNVVKQLMNEMQHSQTVQEPFCDGGKVVKQQNGGSKILTMGKAMTTAYVGVTTPCASSDAWV